MWLKYKNMNTSSASAYLLFGFSLLLLGAGCQNVPNDVSQITPGHIEEAKQYVAEKERVLEDTTNKVEDLENEVEDTKGENEALRQQLAEQQAQTAQREQKRQLDVECEEISKAGRQYLPTKQPIKPLYEALKGQNSEAYFEKEYTSYVAEYEKDQKADHTDFEQQYSKLLEKFERRVDSAYDRYVVEFQQRHSTLEVSGCGGCYDHVHTPESEEPTSMLTRKEYGVWYRENMETPMTREEFQDRFEEEQKILEEQYKPKIMNREEYRNQWLEGKPDREATLAKLKPHYDEYMTKCQ